MTVNELIDECIRLKTGNKEFALFFLPDGSEGDIWIADIGNSCGYVMLGESSGDYRGEGKTMIEALEALLGNLSYGHTYDDDDHDE